jgi:hypothetical protein
VRRRHATSIGPVEPNSPLRLSEIPEEKPIPALGQSGNVQKMDWDC